MKVTRLALAILVGFLFPGGFPLAFASQENSTEVLGKDKSASPNPLSNNKATYHLHPCRHHTHNPDALEDRANA